MRTVTFAAIALAQIGCARAGLATRIATCAIGSPIAESDTSAWSAGLAGTFTLVRERDHDPARVVNSTKLILALASSEERANARAPRFDTPRDLWLSGRWIWPGQIQPDRAEVIGGNRVVLGCSNCFDGSPTYLYPTHVGANGFAGEWVNYGGGLAKNVDKHGKRLPRPEGEFCAIRDAS